MDGLTAKKNNQRNIVINPRILTISEFFNVFSIINLNVLGANSIGNPTTNIKNAVRSNNNFGNAIMKNIIKK